MNVDKNLEKEVLTRLLHAHPSGLDKEVLNNYRSEKIITSALTSLQNRGLIHHGHITCNKAGEHSLNLPIKLSAAGVEAARKLDMQ